MTALQLNAEIYRNLGIIAEDESMLERVAKYLRRVAKQVSDDPTCMTKEEYFAKLERAEQQAARGEYSVLLPGEDITTHLKRLGYTWTSLPPTDTTTTNNFKKKSKFTQ